MRSILRMTEPKMRVTVKIVVKMRRNQRLMAVKLKGEMKEMCQSWSGSLMMP